MKKIVLKSSTMLVPIVLAMAVLALSACQTNTKDTGAKQAVGANSPGSPGVPTSSLHEAASEKGGNATGQNGVRQDGQLLLAIEARLLAQAQASLKAGRFTLPVHNNAYDKFRSVLLINPKNSEARSGMQAILLSYAGLVRAALREGRLSTAENYLQQLQLHYPANPLLAELKKSAHLARQKWLPKETEKTAQNLANAEHVSLSPSSLSARSSEVKGVLASVAKRLVDTRESVLIYARSDGEGRWIYQQLKLSAGYRVRGDIRVAQVPKILFLPPL